MLTENVVRCTFSPVISYNTGNWLCNTGTTSVLFNYCGAASDLLGGSILCLRRALIHLVCMVLERVKSGFGVMLLGFVTEMSSVCFQLTRPLQKEQNRKCFWR